MSLTSGDIKISRRYRYAAFTVRRRGGASSEEQRLCDCFATRNSDRQIYTIAKFAARGAFKGGQLSKYKDDATTRTGSSGGVLFTRVRKYSHRYRSQPKRRIDKLVIPSVGRRCFRSQRLILSFRIIMSVYIEHEHSRFPGVCELRASHLYYFRIDE